jgi:enoyl-CoA hydratase/carnithine racemase
LDSPTTGNLLDRDTCAEVREACHRIAEDPDIRLVIITGAGDAFSVGRESPPSEITEAGALMDWIRPLQVGSCVARLPVPVIAALNGDALDHGLELALAADLRITVEGARLGLTGLDRGSFPLDGGTQRLPRIVGPAWARDMVLTGRTVDAAEALALGLVNRVVKQDALMEETWRLGESIISGAPIAARYAKEAVVAAMDLSLSQGLGLEADLNILLHSTRDRAEGIQSFLERRGPKYLGQ